MCMCMLCMCTYVTLFVVVVILCLTLLLTHSLVYSLDIISLYFDLTGPLSTKDLRDENGFVLPGLIAKQDYR
jgi:hypothetical protein